MVESITSMYIWAVVGKFEKAVKMKEVFLAVMGGGKLVAGRENCLIGLPSVRLCSKLKLSSGKDNICPFRGIDFYCCIIYNAK